MNRCPCGKTHQPPVHSPVVQFTQGQRISDQRLVLDGQDIGKHVRGFVFTVGAGQIPQVLLQLAPLQGVTIGPAESHVALDPEQHDLLVQLGWTPPGKVEEHASEEEGRKQQREPVRDGQQGRWEEGDRQEGHGELRQCG